jgi:hypothetical protein
MRSNRGVVGMGWTAGRAGARAIRGTGTVLICLLLAGACSTTSRRQPEQAPVDLNADGPAVRDETLVRVENQNLADMTIYVYRGSQRMRLGRARGNGTTDLVIPKSMVSGVTELRFQAEPLGNQRGVISQPLPVTPGDIVDFLIPAVVR